MHNYTTDSFLQTIIRKISDGKVVLFLDSGANKGSKNSGGQDSPIGNELSQLIKKEFFPSEEVPLHLPMICACVENRHSRQDECLKNPTHWNRSDLCISIKYHKDGSFSEIYHWNTRYRMVGLLFHRDN